MAAGLKTSIWNNNLRSLALLAFYPVLMAGMLWAGSFIAALALGLPAGAAAAQSKAMIAQSWLYVFGAVGIWFVIAYLFQAKMVRALSHARPVTRREEPELYNMLENLCIARGMKMPRLEIIETHARNAFASGVDDASYAVTLTRGLLNALEKDEIEAVLGHELTHIINRDVRLLIVSVIFTGMIGFLAQMVWSAVRFNTYAAAGRRRDGRLVLVLLAVAAILWIGYFATLFTRFALSRRREFMADAGAVELTRNPEAMMRALLRIAGKDRIPEATDDIALMCIENSGRFFGLMATHPPIAARVQAIARVSGIPVPELAPGRRASEGARLSPPGNERRNPWLTAQRPGRRSPWQ